MQVIRCVIILILLRPCRPPRLPHYVQWKLLRMVGWARRRKGTSIMWMGLGEPRGYLHQH